MKRKISLVIAFALSFLLMFSPIARAEETKFNTVTTSEPVELEVVKIPRDTNSSDSPPQEKVKVPVIDHKPISRGDCVPCPGGGWGYWRYVGDDTQHCFAVC
ncbi:MAG: hypothetical protein ACR2LR_17125 [Hassallia sp.]